MGPEEFDHVLGAAAEVTGLDEFVVIGGQAILGSVSVAPQALLESIEVDLYPTSDPAAADAIDGALGDGSPFHAAFGYYAHGVGPETAKAPKGWRDRLVKRPVPARPGSTRTIVAWCLEPHDLVLSKCVAGRQRDWDYAAATLEAGLVQPDLLVARVADLPVDKGQRAHVGEMIRGLIDRAGANRRLDARQARRSEGAR